MDGGRADLKDENERFPWSNERKEIRAGREYPALRRLQDTQQSLLLWGDCWVLFAISFLFFLCRKPHHGILVDFSGLFQNRN